MIRSREWIPSFKNRLARCATQIRRRRSQPNPEGVLGQALGGLGGAHCTRQRGAEFSATQGDPLPALQATVVEAATVIEALDPARLPESLTIQGFPTTALAAIYHVVEHFSWHTGQIVWIAKFRAGGNHGLAFYDDAKLNKG